jgi:glycosyltransferase involved in cell wall biosynthesis
MHIGIDASFLHFPGVGRHIQCLLLGLDALKLDDQILVYVQANRRQQLERLGLRNVGIRNVNFEPQSLSAQFQWRRLLKEDGIDIFHATHYVHPLWLPHNTKLVITIHDAVYFRFPPRGYKGSLIRIFHNFFMRQAVQNANELISVSDFSRFELASIFGIAPDLFHVVPNGIDPHIIPANMEDCERTRKELALPDRYFLCIGSNKPWKNVNFLLSAFRKMWQSEKRAVLVIAGSQGKNERDMRSLIGEELSPYVKVLGTITEDQLRGLYSSAVATLVPSLYEGFGYAALEAMGCACPVIASTAASLPDVVGDAGILVDPTNAAAWVLAMCSVLDDQNLAQNMKERGFERSQLYSIEAMARKTHAVYLQALKIVKQGSVTNGAA